MSELKPIIEESMIQYAGAVLQSRALVDVRDALKPSARQILYTMFKYKYTSDKSYSKTAAVVGDAMKHFYIHGDSSCAGVVMRAGQPFAMRYPLTDIKGNCGNLIESGNWAATRYTESRLSKLGDKLFTSIDKDCISEWRDNYANDEQYPSVLPSKGFYNIVNGTQGIGIGMASSIPQYNLRELNEALIRLINNPDCDFEEIYCAPDFATGAILYNEKEVKESMKNGTGAACKLRSTVEFDSKERCFVVTEIPYGVYTNTICGELEEIVNGENNPGIERFNDLTGKTALIKIYLTKKALPEKVLKYLFKNTSLQSYFSINFTMLDNGRFPRVFTWKEMLQAHLAHEHEVYVRGHEYDLKKIKDRIHIIDGLLICLASIDEVIKTIKESNSTAEASKKLCTNYLLDEVQAKAVLDMKLGRLAHLEVEKLKNERSALLVEAEKIEEILSSETLLNEEIINGLREIANKFGDDRRTKILNLATNEEEEEIEKKQVSLSFTNTGAVFATETSTLYAQKRNGVGSKFKLDSGEYIIDNLIGETTDQILFFTSHGNFYHMKLNEFSLDQKQYLNNFVTALPYETIVSALIFNKKNASKNILFITKNGLVKKSLLSEYNLSRSGGAKALTLEPNDMIVSALLVDSENIGILSAKSNFIMIATSDINPIGRVSKGVTGIKLDKDNYVVSAHVIPKGATQLFSIAENGMCKRTDIAEFKTTNRNTKGNRIQKAEKMVDFLPITNLNNDILVTSSNAQIRLRIADTALVGRDTQGTRAIKLAENSSIIKISEI